MKYYTVPIKFVINPNKTEAEPWFARWYPDISEEYIEQRWINTQTMSSQISVNDDVAVSSGEPLPDQNWQPEDTGHEIMV